jgi:hypothetical protein
MQEKRHRGTIRLAERILAASAFAALLLCAGPMRTKAEDNDCRNRIVKADHKLHEAIEHHGYESKEADHWRHELHEARERCWKEHRQWWDEDGNRWRHDHDWDDRDHDHR